MFFTACNIDTAPEGRVFTADQKQKIVEANPGRLAADINGMFASPGKQYAIYGASQGRHDDAGYPTVCLSQDLNSADMVSDNSGYNWFSTSSEYSDRSETYANPYMRWAVFYNQIKLANDILESIPEDTDNEQLLVYAAQARAVRAFDYLGLAPYFQYKYKGNEDKPSVPILTDRMEVSYTDNPRAPLSDLYAQIMADLNFAITHLEDYTRTSKGEIDISVAYGLRARANLYMENWSDAASDADKAMQGYTPYSKSDISKPSFVNAADPSWMWAIIIQPSNVPDSYPSWPAVLSSFSGDAYSTGVGCYKLINTLLWDKIPATDVRKGWWVDASLTSPNLAGLTWDGATGNAIAALEISDVKEKFKPYTNVKFGQYGFIGNPINAGDWCIMRVEEMILIKAEATAMAGDLNGGKRILTDWVQAYRDSDYLSKAADPASFQNEVWFQRRVELWGEGFAMADVMRLGKNVVRFNSSKQGNHPEDFRFNLAADNPWLLMRIPQRETNNNLAIPPSKNNAGGAQPKAGDGAGLIDGVTE